MGLDGRIDYDYDRKFSEANHTRYWAAYYAKKGDLPNALKVIDLCQSRYPEAAVYVDDTKITLEYAIGNRDLAYADLLTRFRRITPGEARPWLHLAALSASQGRTYPGELEFCEKAIHPNLFVPQSKFPLPRWSRTSPIDVEAAACLAKSSLTYNTYGSAFLERAWKLEPSNPSIDAYLTASLTSDGRYSMARNVAQTMLVLPLTKEQWIWVPARLDFLRGKPDVAPKKPVFDSGGA